jgi:hypothetical protein
MVKRRTRRRGSDKRRPDLYRTGDGGAPERNVMTMIHQHNPQLPRMDLRQLR